MKDFMTFPVPVQKDLGVALFIVQMGHTPGLAKHWKGLGPGVYELIERRLKAVLARYKLSRRNL